MTNNLPDAVFIEPTNYCNLKCTMCPQGHDLINKKGWLDYSLFEKIMDEIASIPDFKPLIGLHMHGEPLMHKRLTDMIAHAGRQELQTQLHTNGVLLTPEKSKKIIEAGLSEITFSFEGEDKNRYKNLRINSDYDLVRKNIKNFLERKRQTKVIIEILKFRGLDSLKINDSFKSDFPGAEFKSYYASDWHGNIDDPELGEKQIYTSQPGMCKTAQTVFAISWDGLVHPCCLDFNNELIIGDINTQSILEVWHGTQRKEVLHKMKKGLYKKFSLCRHCGAPYTLTTKERNIEQ